MKTYVMTYNRIEGIHFWGNAKPPVDYLKNPHRHVFVIKCRFQARHDDRDIEIVMQQDKITLYISDKYGTPAMFGSMSCEMIAKDILNNFERCASCEVSEDGFGGAIVER